MSKIWKLSITECSTGFLEPLYFSSRIKALAFALQKAKEFGKVNISNFTKYNGGVVYHTHNKNWYRSYCINQVELDKYTSKEMENKILTQE